MVKGHTQWRMIELGGKEGENQKMEGLLMRLRSNTRLENRNRQDHVTNSLHDEHSPVSRNTETAMTMSTYHEVSNPEAQRYSFIAGHFRNLGSCAYPIWMSRSSCMVHFPENLISSFRLHQIFDHRFDSRFVLPRPCLPSPSRAG